MNADAAKWIGFAESQVREIIESNRTAWEAVTELLLCDQWVTGEVSRCSDRDGCHGRARTLTDQSRSGPHPNPSPAFQRLLRYAATWAFVAPPCEGASSVA